MAWEQIQKPWHDTSVEYCEVCGNLLIHHFWRFTASSGEELRACSVECEELYRRLRGGAPRVPLEGGAGT